MAYHSLPLERRNAKIPKEYLYIAIVKYSEDHFKPSKGKRFTKDELEKNKQYKYNQNETIKRLDSGVFNAYNNKIECSNILSSSFANLINNFENTIVYRVDPISSETKSESWNNSKVYYYMSEFKIINKITNKNELIAQIKKDGLLEEFSACVFDSFSYGNEGYFDILYNYFKEIKENYPDVNVYLSDIIITNDYNHYPRPKFKPNSIYQITKDNIQKLLDDNLISYTNRYEYYQADIITTLINCGMSKIVYEYICHTDPNNYSLFITKKEFDASLRLHSSDEYIKKIIDKLDIKLSGVTLKIEKHCDYGDNKISEVRFNNINEVKSYLIKTYDVPFEDLQKDDISKIESGGWEDTCYTFTIE